MSRVCAVLRFLSRRKKIHASVSREHTLARVLNTLDLTALGIGCTLGSGVYVIIGSIAHSTAGPSIVLSFIIAGIASILAGLCYAEFGARVPRAGSAYIYSYVTVGEFWAFIIGWNLILEYVIGTASIARATSSYIDSLTNGEIVGYFKNHMPIHVYSLSSYPDFLSFVITMLFALALCYGVKESSFANNIFTLVNLAVVLYIVICGSVKANTHNWAIPYSEIPTGNDTGVCDETKGCGKGGFFPFGLDGMLEGAASCFYAFVGFDVIATTGILSVFSYAMLMTGEEVINPERAIPLSIVLSLTVCGAAYISIATVLTLIVPYYTLAGEAPLPPAFIAVGYTSAYYFISVGALCSLFTCLLTTIFPMPRIIFAMARDGLLFKFLGRVSRRFKTPYVATLISAFLAVQNPPPETLLLRPKLSILCVVFFIPGMMAMLFSLDELVEMMSIGTLLAYTLVAACVLILRYEVDSDSMDATMQDRDDVSNDEPAELTCTGVITRQCCRGCSASGGPTPGSSLFVKCLIGILALETILLDAFVVYIVPTYYNDFWLIAVIGLPVIAMIATLSLIAVQPTNNGLVTFKVPFVPVLPAFSIILNIYLMLKLRYLTWIRFGIWLAIGFAIYFGYGIRHGGEHQEIILEDEEEDVDRNKTSPAASVNRTNSVPPPDERTRLLS